MVRLAVGKAVIWRPGLHGAPECRRAPKRLLRVAPGRGADGEPGLETRRVTSRVIAAISDRATTHQSVNLSPEGHGPPGQLSAATRDVRDTTGNRERGTRRLRTRRATVEVVVVNTLGIGHFDDDTCRTAADLAKL